MNAGARAGACLAALMGLAAAFRPAAPAARVSIVSDPTPGAAVRHGLAKLRAALAEKGFPVDEASRLDVARGDVVIVAGLGRGPGAAAGLLASRNVEPLAAAESLLISHTEGMGKKVLLVTGADDRGVMYALLDVADRIGWAGDTRNPLSEVRDVREQPAVAERALSIYTMHRAHFEGRFFDEAYWARYLDMLAENRFNAFALLFAYETAGYFSPAYPYFFDVEGFPEVQVVAFTNADQQRHFAALKRLIEMAHQRGLMVTIGLWDHIYRGGVQSGGMDVQPGKPVPGIVAGLTDQNLTPYSKAALEKFLTLFPEVDVVQFRMHGESGLKKDEMHGFWKSLYEVMNRHPRVRFELRAKDFPDSLIDLAVEMGVRFRICTKYWAEQMGLPFHPTHINRQNQFDRRHGYADLLRYPKRYEMHWQLWNGGTTRVLLWGDPEWVRRFAESMHLYGGQGYEVTEMLATKMASQPHDMPPVELLSPQYRYYEWEFERYWHFYQVFGRVGYNPATPPDVWRREFERRFGSEAAPHVEGALHRASRVLGMINAYNFPYNRFPTTRGWAEKQRREDLPDYAKAEGSDTEQFLGMTEAARCLLEGCDSAKVSPQQSSRWFAAVAEDVLKEVEQAERRVGRHRTKEFISTVADLRILAHLASYHSRRALAGFSYAVWEQFQDASALDDAMAHEGRAIEAWQAVVDAAGDVYVADLRMGRASVGLSGHWRDELAALEKGLEDLKRQRASFQPAASEAGPSIAHAPVRRLRPGEALVVRATVGGAEAPAVVRVVYTSGGTAQSGGEEDGYSRAAMDRVAPFVYRSVIPASKARDGLRYFIEAVDPGGRRIAWPKGGAAEAVEVRVTADEEPPLVKHSPVTRARPGQPLTIAAEVSDPSRVKWVRLRYRGVNQHFDYKTLEMRPTHRMGEYRAVVPPDDVVPQWDFMYFIEVMDQAGNGKIHPELWKEQPYIVVRLER